MPFSKRLISGSRTAGARAVFRRAFQPDKSPSPLRIVKTPDFRGIDQNGRRNRPTCGSRSDHRSSEKKASRSLLSGSITVEAALVLPIALFFVMTFFSFFSILRTQVEVQKIMEQSMERVAVTAASGAAEAVSEVLIPGHADSIEAAANMAMLEAGVRTGLADMDDVDGVTLLGTDLNIEEGTAKLVVTYGVRVRTALFRLPPVRLTQVSYRRLWTGTEAEGAEGRDGQIVYITEHGTVYHLSRNCRHLVQRTEMMTWEQLLAARSSDGAIYYACRYCHPRQSDGRFFVAAYGNRYHSTLSCPELRITVRAVTMDEVGGLPCCSTCAAGG